LAPLLDVSQHRLLSKGNAMRIGKSLIGFLVMLLAWASLAFAAVDINSANEADLDKIKGVGPAKAKAIIEERKKNGPFKDLDDVAARVKGIGDKTVATWKKSGEVSIGGGTAAGKAAAPAAKPAAAAQAPVKSEPPKAEVKKAEPAKAEAKKAEPAKADTKKAEPAKAEAKKAEPAKADTKKAAPAKAEKDSKKTDAKKDDKK
jgi:competence ComEA-like helix-hairpin-helix protein